MIVNEFENITLQCRSEGFPPPLIRWFRLINETRRSLDETSTTNFNGNYSLINVTRTDAGHYECQAGTSEVSRRLIELRVLCK